MAKEATLQVRMDADLKEKAEALYRELGISFADPVKREQEEGAYERAMVKKVLTPTLRNSLY